MSTIDHDSTPIYRSLYWLIPLVVLCMLAALWAVIRFQGAPFMMVPG